MAGIYIHIPFCKTRCTYCDFFSSTSMNEKEAYIDALCKELFLRKDYLQKQKIKSLYFGGGTPSQLSIADFKRIFDAVYTCFDLSLVQEITLEANPDDLNAQYLQGLAKLPFNRISLGIQSFQDQELHLLKRRHNAQAAIIAVQDCRNAGFNNISIDLMYGLPGQTMEIWENNLSQAIRLNVQHISAYHLIYEEGTVLYKLLKENTIKDIDENLSLAMFEKMMDTLDEAGFEHYEISSFAKNGLVAKHNSSYWDGTHYLGIGSAAHSYDGKSRQWNISELQTYIESIEKGELAMELEVMDIKQNYQDYILTRLRTKKGININELEMLFGEEIKAHFLKKIDSYIKNATVCQIKNVYSLTRKGIFISDGIMSGLFI